MQRESRILEYKEKINDLRSISKSVIAFANGDGGKIIIGIEDKTGRIVGLSPDTVDSLLERLPVSFADAIRPGIYPQVFEKTINGKEVVIVQVFPGGQKPYFLEAEGINKGVYVRVGSHTKRAEGEILEELRLHRSHMSYDEMPMTECDVHELDRSLLPANLRTDKALLSLGITRPDPFSGTFVPTLGGVLMIHGKPHRYISEANTIVSRMRGNTGRETIETHEITGPLGIQCESALDLLSEWLGREPRVHGARYAYKKYAMPPEVLREAINNALFHRQYSIPGAVKIALYSDRCEIFSPGHFAGPFIEEELGDGTSYIRNRVVCLVARRMHLIEKRGTGIRFMIDTMQAKHMQPPRFQEGAGWFKVILYLNHRPDTNEATDDFRRGMAPILNRKGAFTSTEVCNLLGVSKATALTKLGRLIATGRIERIGKGPGTRYRKI